MTAFQCFLIIFVANIVKKNDDEIACPITEYNYDEAVKAANTTVTACFCESNIDEIADDENLLSFCENFLEDFAV